MTLSPNLCRTKMCQGGQMQDSSLRPILTSAQIVVCVGSGGVGKTTAASALAFQAAKLGRRVLVLTIDPSRRLRSTMGLGDEDIAQIKNEKITGELWASIVDPKKTFDEFVLRAAKYSKGAERLLSNPLYIQLSTNLSGSQEFTALERLYSAYESQKYDLIVLDTPPTKHAIDFLEAPQKLSAIFSDSVAKWFREPEGQGLVLRLMKSGTKQVLKSLELLTGSEFMRELSDFFQNIEGWQKKLESRIADVHGLLVSPHTHFILVSSLDEAKIAEAQYFAREIKKGGYQLSALIVNRIHPAWIVNSQTDGTRSDLEQKLIDYYAEREQMALGVEPSIPTVVKIPELRENISDIGGVIEMARYLFEESPSKSSKAEKL